MARKIRWGILGTANIAVRKVIPAMQLSKVSSVSAIASRKLEKAQGVAKALGIADSFGSYQELLDDQTIEAVYIPLPNNLHLEWVKKAAEAGKHALCEKPIGMNAAEVRNLIEIRDKCGVKIQEAFMVRTHPTWLLVRDLVESGRVGNVKAITCIFSYFNTDKTNIRNSLEMGGGALMDIGCYCVNFARFIYGQQPLRVLGLIKRDETSGIDSTTTGLMDFQNGQASFVCSTQMVPYQKIQVLGSKGRIEIQIPFNIPVDSPTKVIVEDGFDLRGNASHEIECETANQYTIQADLFSRSILEDSEQAIPLEDSFRNMAAVDALFESAETGLWVRPEQFN